MSKAKKEPKQTTEEQPVTEATEATEETVSEADSLLEEERKKSEDYLDKLKRSMAEFDNFKKRTQKEKDELYGRAQADAVTAFLPLIDNLERAYQAATQENADAESIVQGMNGILKQLNEILNGLEVKPIPAVGESFDPNLHNAVMHIEDESVDDNTVIEEFQKGYQMKDRVLRHSMVKVAN